MVGRGPQGTLLRARDFLYLDLDDDYASVNICEKFIELYT